MQSSGTVRPEVCERAITARQEGTHSQAQTRIDRAGGKAKRRSGRPVEICIAGPRAHGRGMLWDSDTPASWTVRRSLVRTGPMAGVVHRGVTCRRRLRPESPVEFRFRILRPAGRCGPPRRPFPAWTWPAVFSECRKWSCELSAASCPGPRQSERRTGPARKA